MASRVLSRAQFSRILRTGSRTTAGPVRAYWLHISGVANAFGLTIKNGTLGRAVDRNRWKRIMREIVRSTGFLKGNGCAIVFVLFAKPDRALTRAAWDPLVSGILDTAGAC